MCWIMWFVALCISIGTCTSIENSIHLIGFLFYFCFYNLRNGYLLLKESRNVFFIIRDLLNKSSSYLGHPFGLTGTVARHSTTVANPASKICHLTTTRDLNRMKRDHGPCGHSSGIRLFHQKKQGCLPCVSCRHVERTDTQPQIG